MNDIIFKYRAEIQSFSSALRNSSSSSMLWIYARLKFYGPRLIVPWLGTQIPEVPRVTLVGERLILNMYMHSWRGTNIQIHGEDSFFFFIRWPYKGLFDLDVENWTSEVSSNLSIDFGRILCFLVSFFSLSLKI